MSQRAATVFEMNTTREPGVRTSVNDPIQVALLEEADHGLPGRIGLTIAPGKKDLARRWDRDLELDLSRLRDELGVELLALLDRLPALAEPGPPDAATLEQLGGGWTGEEALAIALLCALTADTSSPDGLRAALWRAAAHSGDSDSTAAICGGLLGAMHGEALLPNEWLEELELRCVIERLANDLYEALLADADLDRVDYPPN